MIIALIDGSPKVKESASAILLNDLKSSIGEKAEIIEIKLRKDIVSEDLISILKKADAWAFAFPLYVDGVPAHLLSCLVQLEKGFGKKVNKKVLAISNCGLYEGIQTEPALQIFENWCAKCGFTWCGGIGVGAGGSVSSFADMEYNKGIKKPIGEAFDKLISAVITGEKIDNIYVSVAMPRFVYQAAAQLGWRQKIKANGGKIKDLKKQF